MLRSSLLLSVLLLSGCAAGARPMRKVEPELSAEELRSEVAASWRAWTQRLTERAARDPDLRFDAAVEWLEQALRAEILEAVRAELEARFSRSLAPEDVAAAWAEREPGRAWGAGYGAGTWLLGEGDARAGLETAEEKADPTSEKSSEREALEERIRRYLKNQEMVRKARSDSGDEGDAAEFWREWTSQGRAQWMLAYYVERGGDVRVLDVRFSSCADCNRTGVREYFDPVGGQTHLLECWTCRHLGIQRSVVYR